ncbi:MAG: methylglyoxal synthase [Deltaproteobacteria bacterium]|nr:methylglyoxal synthase [Deltaproteobacteria bacterium]
MNKMKKKRLALIAHDGKKAEMVGFVKDNLKFIRKFDLIATGTTGRYLEQADLKVKKVESGPQGGDAQIAAMIVEGALDGVIFLRDPLGIHPHEPDIFMLLRLADVRNIPLATNLASANILIRGL